MELQLKKEWLIRGKVRGTGKWTVIATAAPDISERGWHKFKSLEEAKNEMKRHKDKQDWEIENKRCKTMDAGGGIGVSMEYYPEYDIIEWEVRERQVSGWYNPEEGVDDGVIR